MAELVEASLNADQPVADLSPATVAFLTTEHYTLQSAQSATISETNGRTALFVASVSGGLVAIAFIGQASHLGSAFYIFGIIVLFSLAFLGIAAFERTIQSSIENVAYAKRIARIRRFYLSVRPELAEVLAPPPVETDAGIMRDLAIRNLWWQSLIAAAGTVAVLNSLLLGGAVGLLVGFVSGELVAASITGAAVAVCSILGHLFRQRSLWRRSGAS